MPEILHIQESLHIHRLLEVAAAGRQMGNIQKITDYNFQRPLVAEREHITKVYRDEKKRFTNEGSSRL